MWRRSPWLVIGVIGLLIAALAWYFLRPRPTLPQPRRVVAEATVVVARIDLPTSTVLREEHLTYATVTEFIPDGAARISEVVGKVTMRSFSAGEPIRQGALSLTRIALAAAALPPRYQAIVLPLGEEPTLFDFINPGDRVDVLATFDSRYTVTLARGVVVLALGLTRGVELVRRRMELSPEAQAAAAYARKRREERLKKEGAAPEEAAEEKPAGPPKPERRPSLANVTLAVTPEQAEILALASHTATLRIVLCSRWQ